MNKNILLGVAGLVVLAVLVGGAVFYYRNTEAPATETPNATSTPQGDANPNPSPSPGTDGVPTPPGAPIVTTDQGAVPSNSTAVLTGKVVPNGAQTSYWYEYGRTASLGSRTAAQGIGSGFAQINAPAYITGLAAHTTYYYRLSAQNALGTVNGAMYTFGTNDNPPPQGAAPTVRTSAATDVARTGAQVNGQVDPNRVQTSYWFEYGETSALGNTSAFVSAGTGDVSMNVSAILANLKPLTKYYFRVNAQNQYGTVNGSILNFTTKGPAAPSTPVVDTTSAADVATSSATLRASVNPNGAATTYWFEYGQDSLLGNILAHTTETQLSGSGTASISVSTKVFGLNADTRYYYRVVARNSFGTVRGDIVNFRTDRK